MESAQSWFTQSSDSASSNRQWGCGHRHLSWLRGGPWTISKRLHGTSESHSSLCFPSESFGKPLEAMNCDGHIYNSMALFITAIFYLKKPIKQMGNGGDVTILGGVFVQQRAQQRRRRGADEMGNTNYSNFLEEGNWDYSSDLHKAENHLESRKFKMVMRHLEEPKKKKNLVTYI